jgi:cytochrome bd-type quinol oxidase subunit 1
VNTDLARWQFAFTTINHFLFVPVTIGLAFLTAQRGSPAVDRRGSWRPAAPSS